MTVTAATPLAKAPTVQDAREELGKFFVIADLADKVPEMFSEFVDAEWHRLMRTPDYSAFCMMSVGHPVGHVEDKGYGTPSWLDIYHERFGTLPAAWFASEDGTVDQQGYTSYLDTRTAGMQFDCSATTNPPDVTTSWDCTLTTNDPDFTPRLAASWDCNTGPTPTNPNMLLNTQPDTILPPVPDVTPEKAK